jgi:hypothetical protein
MTGGPYQFDFGQEPWKWGSAAKEACLFCCCCYMAGLTTANEYDTAFWWAVDKDGSVRRGDAYVTGKEALVGKLARNASTTPLSGCSLKKAGNHWTVVGTGGQLLYDPGHKR